MWFSIEFSLTGINEPNSVPGCACFVRTNFIGWLLWCYEKFFNLICGPCISWDFAATISFSWSTNCSSLALKLFILDTTTAYLIGLSCPNFFTHLSFSFFNNTRCLVLLLCLWFLSFLCHNFLTFLSEASSHSTLVAIGYLFVSIPKASSPLSLLFSCFYLNFLVRIVVSGVTAR